MGGPVRYEVIDRVAVVTIDRPEVRNAMDLETFEALGAAAARAAADDSAAAVLVRGEGATFSSGIDVNLFATTGADGIDDGFIVGLQASFNAFEDLDKPTVAAIEGPCFGAGLQLALACHIRAVARTASMSVLEARWGLIPDLGGTYRLPRLVGLGRATELVVSARRVDAEQAVAIGLADVRLWTEDPAEDALAYARTLAAAPGSTRRAIRLLRANLARDRDAALAAEREAQLACLGGPDFAEAVAARLAGRDPRFVGD